MRTDTSEGSTIATEVRGECEEKLTGGIGGWGIRLANMEPSHKTRGYGVPARTQFTILRAL